MRRQSPPSRSHRTETAVRGPHLEVVSSMVRNKVVAAACGHGRSLYEAFIFEDHHGGRSGSPRLKGKGTMAFSTVYVTGSMPP